MEGLVWLVGSGWLVGAWLLVVVLELVVLLLMGAVSSIVLVAFSFPLVCMVLFFLVGKIVSI